MDQNEIASVDDYIAAFPPAVQERLQSMRSIVRAEAPEAVERISYRMPAFFLGRVLVYFAAFGKHIGFYPGADGVAAFQSELAGFKHAKGSVQFPLDQPLPIDLITRMVRFKIQTARLAGGR